MKWWNNSIAGCGMLFGDTSKASALFIVELLKTFEL